MPGLVPLDLRDPEALRRLPDQGFDLVVHAAGLVDLSDAERQPELARQLNAASVATLRDAVRGTGTRILLMSTDNVFDGTADTYTEGDERAPVNAYGRSKRAAEDALIGADALVGEDAFAGADTLAGADGRLAGGHLVVRIPLVYGRSPIADRFMARFDGPRTPARTDGVRPGVPALAARCPGGAVGPVRPAAPGWCAGGDPLRADDADPGRARAADRGGPGQR
ncbi:sugar nucleotide-binding protein [Streptomyces malaysiensis]|uniref:dTDP-4-dehydrorhamnose reductase n=1 Tax=Streptomyces malaysiensis subsp. samsunensis TaxID=459658 RepID=A0A9X2M860_STRMQ|nr:sugar nucleotide-binding protein [Streptomyces samsunensis]MCQ8834784.1 sugar nucleotide-binding protein [Streptomyces samsunensis]